MKKAVKFALIVLSLCLCLSFLTACGKAGFESVAEEILKSAKETKGFSNIYDFKCIGAIDDTAVELKGRYWREQSETSGNIYDDISNNVRVGEVYGREYITFYLNDGKYYFTEEETFTTSEPVVTMDPVPGINFWPVFISSEKVSANEDSFSCTVVLYGDDLKETIKEYCPRIYSEVAPFIDWNAASGEVYVDLDEIGYVEEMKISCPDLGKVMVQSVNPEAEAKCTDFDITIYCSYYDADVMEPGDKAIAKESAAPAVYGMNSLIKFLFGENEEAEEIIAEQEEAKNFVPEIIEEGSVTFSCNGVNVSLEVPSEIKFYSDINHMEQNLAILSHSVTEGGISGRTIVELVRGTPDDYLGSFRMGPHTTKDVEINGISGKLITEKSSETNYFGQKVYEENYFFAADVGGAILGIRFESAYNENNVGVVSENIISELMNHITIG